MSIDNVAGVRNDITEMLERIRSISSKTQVFAESSVAPAHNFSDVMSMAKTGLQKIGQLQSETQGLKNDYISGTGNVSMAQVVVASQKSKLAFEGLIAVRNKILEAYKDIMNMPV